jgi:hypothetical protein
VACFDSQSTLIPSYNGRQISGSVPGQYYSGSSCFWKIAAPGEWTSNSIIKLRIVSLNGATCFLNYGGAITASKFDMIEKECKAGETYEFMYKNFAYDSNIHLVSWALYTDNNPIKEQFGQVEFEYWVVNEDSYETLWKYFFLSFLIFGAVLCSMMLMIYKSGI